jgi:serine/threonine protein kinase
MSSNLTTQDHEVDDAEFQDELKPGAELLRGQYVIEQFLNNGGFGITYLAKDSLDRLVVIKECFPESICRRNNSTVCVRSRNQAEAFRTIVDLFISEARNLARLSHPNIVGIHQVFEDNDTAYLAMDFVEGLDLLEIVESSNAFNPSALEAITLKLLDAIEFIHHEGILHRDIAPDNILLSSDNEPVLIDFGAARETVEGATEHLSSMRTVKDGYSPQEFYAAGSQQYPSSDLYSLAASLYHVMTKELPVSAQERLTAIASGDKDPYVSIKGLVTGYSASFLNAIDQALDVFPKNRIQSAAEWRAMLTQGDATGVTRGTASRPILAVNNGAVVEQFEKTELKETPGARSKTDNKSRPHKMRPRSDARSKIHQSVFAEDDVPVGMSPDVVKTSVNLSSGKSLSLGVATAALLVLVIGGVAMTTSGKVSDEAAEQTQVASSSVATNNDTDTEPEQSGLFLTEMPDGTAIASVEQTQEAPVIEAGSVMRGVGVEFAVAADPTDPTLVASVKGTLAEVLSPGDRLVSVNGSRISSFEDVHSIVSSDGGLAMGDVVTLALSIENAATGETTVQSIDLPASQETILSNGARFQTFKDGDVWATVVTVGTGKEASDLHSGDQIIALMPNNELINAPESLPEIFTRELAAGTDQYNFAVNRGGEMWFTTMQYDGLSQN